MNNTSMDKNAKIYIAGSASDSEYPGSRGPLTDTPVARVADAGHLLMWDNPRGWAATLDAALTRLEIAAGSTASSDAGGA